mgnify:CR=1 FL=1
MAIPSNVSFVANAGKGYFGVPSQLVVPTPSANAIAAGYKSIVLAESVNTGFGSGDDAVIYCGSSASSTPKLTPGCTVACNFDPRSAAPAPNGAMIIQHADTGYTRGWGLSLGSATGDTNRRRVAIYSAGLNSGNWIDLPGSSFFPHIGTGFAFAITLSDDGSELRYYHTGALAVGSVAVTGTIIPPNAGDVISIGRAVTQLAHASNIAFGGVATSSKFSTDDELIALCAKGMDAPIPTLANENFRLEAGTFSFGNNYAKVADGLSGVNTFTLQGALRPQLF